MILYNKKAKCQNCLALISVEEKGVPVLKCKLGYKVSFHVMSGNAVRPKPKEKCYKPLTTEDYEKAEALITKAAKVAAAKLAKIKPGKSSSDHRTPLEDKYL